MRPYIVFALPRTGSTTLVRLLNCRHGLRCLFEPFNAANRDPLLAECYRRRPEIGLERVVQSLWRHCNGFKHVWRWDDWPFQDDPDLNRRLLVGSGANIILLHRKNILRRAISGQISDQMQIWTPWNPEEFQRIRAHEFKPLDIPLLTEDIEGARRALAWARGHIQREKNNARELAYEEFLDPHLPMESRMEAVQSIFEFIGVGRETDPARLDGMRTLLDPETTSFQNEKAYPKIPNIRQVEEQLGSPQNGYVFDPPAP